VNSIQQTRFFAQNYPQLQGLRAVPLGLCLLVVTVWANLQNGPARDLTLPILLALACLVLYVLIDQYYNRVYGKVKRLYSHAELLWSAAGTVLALAAFVLDSLDLVDISLLGLVFAATFVFTGYWYWRRATVLYATSLVLAAVFVVLSLLPLVGIQDWWNLLGLKHSLLAFSFLFGVFGVLGGILAHIYFIRSLPASPEEI
jgi:hypothetical protein